jgi:hypothetical protein
MSRRSDQPPFGIDLDILHSPESVFVRIYRLDRLNRLLPHAELRLSVGAHVLDHYDAFQREYKWPDAEDVEARTGTTRDHLDDPARNEAASQDLAELLVTWLILKAKAEVITRHTAPGEAIQ